MYEDEDLSPCSIKNILTFLGENEEQIHKLSLAFYLLIWEDKDNPHFRSHFTKSVKSPEEAADNPARWLIEMLGGPPRYAEKHGSGLVGTRMLSLHASPIHMTCTHACTVGGLTIFFMTRMRCSVISTLARVSRCNS